MEKNALLHGFVPTPPLYVVCFPDCLCRKLYAEFYGLCEKSSLNLDCQATWQTSLAHIPDFF